MKLTYFIVLIETKYDIIFFFFFVFHQTYSPYSPKYFHLCKWQKLPLYGILQKHANFRDYLGKRTNYYKIPIPWTRCILPVRTRLEHFMKPPHLRSGLFPLLYRWNKYISRSEIKHPRYTALWHGCIRSTGPNARPIAPLLLYWSPAVAMTTEHSIRQ